MGQIHPHNVVEKKIQVDRSGIEPEVSTIQVGQPIQPVLEAA